MAPELKDAVGEVTHAGGLIVVVGVCKHGIAVDDDFIGRVGHNETIADSAGNGNQGVTVNNQRLSIYRQDAKGVNGQVVELSVGKNGPSLITA